MANVTVATGGTSNIEAGNRVSVRTSGNRVYALVTNGTTVFMQKGNVDGEPASFSTADSIGSITGLQDIGGAIAIDSNDIIHCIYYVVDTSHGGIVACRYVAYNTSNDTFGTPESVATLDNDDTGAYANGIAIAIDANDDPHVVWRDALSGMGTIEETIWYSNKISGSWKARQSAISADVSTWDDLYAPSIIIGEPTSAIGADRPIISAVLSFIGAQINVVYGTALDASAFTSQADVTGSIDVNNIGSGDQSIAIDSNGKITIAFIEEATNDLMVVEHLASSAWSSWETPVDVDTSTDYLNPSIAVIGTDRYIFVEDSTNSDINLWKDEGSGWTEETTDPDLPNVGTFNDVKVKWANYWNHLITKTEYTFDGTVTDNQNAWVNDDNFADGSDTTFAEYPTGGGKTSAKWIEVNGTDAPASGGNIDRVQCMVTISADCPQSVMVLQALDGGTVLTTASQGSQVSTKTTRTFTVAEPVGGWTWAKLQGLEVRVWSTDSDTCWLRAFIAKIRVWTFEDESSDLDYVFEASNGDVLYNTFLVVSGGTAFDRTAVQTITESDTVARIQGHNRTVAQSITESEVVIREGSTFIRAVAQSITEIDAVGRVQSHIRAVAELITESDSVVRQFGVIRTANQSITESDAVATSQGLTRTANQTITESDAVVRILGSIRTAVQTITESDVVAKLQVLSRTVAQSITESDAVAKLQVLARTASQTITESDAVAKLQVLARTAVQTITESDVAVTQKGFARTASQTITESDVVTKLQVLARTANQTITESDVISRIQGHIRAVAQTITESDVVVTQKGFLRTANQTITESDVVAKLQVLTRTVAQAITHSSVTIREFSTFIRAVAQSITESDAVATSQGLTRTASQTITESDAVVTQKGFLRTVVQTITESDAVVRLGVFVRTANQTITESDSVARVQNSLRTAVQTITESDAVVTAGGLARQVVQTITESDVVVRSQVLARTVAQNLTHSSVVLREFSTFVRTVAQSITESDVVATSQGLTRTAVQTITESDVVATTKGFLRTVAQTITESDSVVRLATNTRTVAQSITESDSAVRLQSIFRTVAQSITESDVVTRTQDKIRTAVQIITHSSVVARIQSLLRSIAQLITHSSSVVSDHQGQILPIQKRLTQSLAILENTDRTDVALDSTGETLAILENTDTTTIKTKKVV